MLDARDTIVQAGYGTGKTVAFTIAVLQQIDLTQKQCQALILAPTRELAQQIHKVARALGDFLNVTSHACVGGTLVRDDVKILREGVQIVVGTPGRVYGTNDTQDVRVQMDNSTTSAWNNHQYVDCSLTQSASLCSSVHVFRFDQASGIFAHAGQIHRSGLGGGTAVERIQGSDLRFVPALAPHRASAGLLVLGHHDRYEYHSCLRVLLVTSPIRHGGVGGLVCRRRDLDPALISLFLSVLCVRTVQRASLVSLSASCASLYSST